MTSAEFHQWNGRLTSTVADSFKKEPQMSASLSPSKQPMANVRENRGLVQHQEKCNRDPCYRSEGLQ